MPTTMRTFTLTTKPTTLSTTTPMEKMNNHHQNSLPKNDTVKMAQTCGKMNSSGPVRSIRVSPYHRHIRHLYLCLLFLLSACVPQVTAITAAVDDVNITALRQLCDRFKHERFNVVYDVYGWSLEKMPGYEQKNVTSIHQLQGFCVDIFKEFLRLCPIDYRLYQNGDQLWGIDYNETKQAWEGMVGELVYGKADMGE